MIDETCGMIEAEEAKKLARTGVRTLVMQSLQLNGYILSKSPAERMSNLGYILRLAVNRTLRWSHKRRIKVNVNELADAWIKSIVAMCLSHDRDGYDEADAQADKLLSPLLAAPVAQVREFYFALLAKMKEDKRVPYLVIMAYEAWGEALVKNAPDEGVKRLKKKLAQEIVDLAELQVRDQWSEAMKRALMWRDPETLEKVKERLEAGEKPKVAGRQSCLFLELGRGTKKVSAML